MPPRKKYQTISRCHSGLLSIAVPLPAPLAEGDHRAHPHQESGAYREHRKEHGRENQRFGGEDEGLLPAEWQLFQSLQDARAALARRGLIRVPRAAEDDPALVETWL